jgi:hypothetical protein
MRRSPSRLAAGLLMTLLVVLTGCGAPDDEAALPTATTTLPPKVPTDLVDVPVGSGDVGPGDRVRVRGSVLRVNGHVVDLAPLRVEDVAVVEGGVFFRNGSELWFTDLGRARATGYSDVQSLIASPDGRRLAFLDMEHGPKDEDGTPLAISIAYDATTGKALVASYAGMGDVLDDDLRDLYENGDPAIIGFEDDNLVVKGADAEVHRISLAVGAAQ